MYNSSMIHPKPLKPVPQIYAVNDPLPSELEFPGCKPVHLPRGEIETYDGRLEFRDARTETALVCEPTGPYHEQPSQTLAALVHGIAGVRGSPIKCYGAMDLLVCDARGRRRGRMAGLTIHLLKAGVYRVSGESRAFPGRTAQDIMSATGRHATRKLPEGIAGRRNQGIP